MSKNYVQPGNTITCIAPTGGVVSGRGYLIGTFFVVAQTTVAATEEFEGEVVGVHDLPKATGAVTFGAKLYWDATNARLTTTASGNSFVGAATAAALSADANARVRLNGISI